MKHISAFDPSEISQIVATFGQPSYRIKQIYNWLYKKGAKSFDQMQNLPKSLRDNLKRQISFCFPKIVKVLTSRDGTQKFLLQLPDKALIETVAIKGKGGTLTLCLSCQVGCRQGCAFCVTGNIGFRRSLLHNEISDQVLVISEFLRPQRARHLVFMGMGEPLDNYDHVIKALKTLIDTERGGFNPGHITLSTVGIIPGIDRIGKENLGIKLAISLNAPNDKIRDALMPVNKKFPLPYLLRALQRYPYVKKQRITLEYCLIKGINDSIDCAQGLSSLLKGLKKGFKVNLIPYNQSPLLPFYAPTSESLLCFQKYLTESGILSTVRKSKGRDILAACGQLGYRGNIQKEKQSPK